MANRKDELWITVNTARALYQENTENQHLYMAVRALETAYLKEFGEVVNSEVRSLTFLGFVRATREEMLDSAEDLFLKEKGWKKLPNGRWTDGFVGELSQNDAVQYYRG